METNEVITIYSKKEKPWKDQLPGGKADKNTPADLTNKERKDWEKGIPMEKKEHTTSNDLAAEIALDHEIEFKEEKKGPYYKHLKKMEENAKE